MAIGAVDDILEERERIGVVMAEHVGAGEVTGGGTLGGPSLGPLTARIAGWKELERLIQVGLDVVEDHVLGDVLGIHGLNGAILAVFDEQRNLLVVGG